MGDHRLEMWSKHSYREKEKEPGTEVARKA
jgi:hypothetical protein